MSDPIPVLDLLDALCTGRDVTLHRLDYLHQGNRYRVTVGAAEGLGPDLGSALLGAITALPLEKPDTEPPPHFSDPVDLPARFSATEAPYTGPSSRCPRCESTSIDRATYPGVQCMGCGKVWAAEDDA